MATAAARKQLYDDLLRLFPSTDRLAQMVRFQLDASLAVISGRPDLGGAVFDLLDWAEANGKLDALIAATRWERPPCPYPGMAPFKADSRFFAYFYGRNAETETLLARLRDARFVLVVGPSGAGKSSLVYAGLLPRLAGASFWPAGTWLVREMRPGDRPDVRLADLLGGNPGAPATMRALLTAHPPATRLLVVIDQLEELFSLAEPASRAAFVAGVKTLIADNRCTVLATMRADFYPDLMNSDLWTLAQGNRQEVTVLRGAALREALIAPASAVGVELEPGLVERLLADAADEPGVLPLLQETMVLLWERMEGRTLPLRAYQALGEGGRSGLEIALARKADATLAALPPEQQTVARRIFLRLVQFGEGRADTRRQQTEADLRAQSDDPALFDQTLHYLADNRLLTLGGEGSTPTVDIAHEALIAGWPILSDWLLARRSTEQARRRLEAQAAEWVRLGRARAGLLDEVELHEAERWLAAPDAADLGTSPDLAALIAASRAELDRQAAAAEAARQEKMAQERRLAAEQQERAAAEAKMLEQDRRARWGLILAFGAATLTAVIFVPLSQPLVTPDSSWGFNSLQFAYSPERMHIILAHWTSDPAKAANFYFLMGFNFFILLLFAICQVAGTVWAAQLWARHSTLLGRAGYWLAWIIALAAMLNSLATFALLSVAGGTNDPFLDQYVVFDNRISWPVQLAGLAYVLGAGIMALRRRATGHGEPGVTASSG